MSVYNNSDTIEAAIESILEQTYKDFEFLILDDGSTDNTKLTLNKYTSNHKIKIYSNKSNIGLTKSLNILINKSKGEYIARQDADDKSLPERLNFQINNMQTYSYDISTTLAYKDKCKFWKITPKIRYLIPIFIQIRINNPFVHGTLMIKKDILKEIGMYDERFFYSQDYKLFYDLVTRKLKIKKHLKPMYVLNTKGNISSLKKAEQQYFAKCVRQRLSP